MPGWLTGRSYKTPERYTADVARERRLIAALDKSRKELEARTSPLSPANKVHLNRLKEFQSKFKLELDARRREVERLKKAEPSMENSRRLSAAISGHFQLRAKQLELLQRAAQERRAHVSQESSADRRFFSFGDAFNPRTVFGTPARASVFPFTRKMFSTPALTIPCIARAMRREVMFAKGHGGKGHKVRHRRSPYSGVEC